MLGNPHSVRVLQRVFMFRLLKVKMFFRGFGFCAVIAVSFGFSLTMDKRQRFGGDFTSKRV